MPRGGVIALKNLLVLANGKSLVYTIYGGFRIGYQILSQVTFNSRKLKCWMTKIEPTISKEEVIQ